MAREASICARGLALAALIALTLVLPTAPADAGGSPCKNGSAPAGSISKAKVRAAVDCMINRARSRRGVPALKQNDDLDRLGQGHSKLMVKKHCFRHRCGDEPSVKQRFEASPYVKGASSFSYSEKIAYDATARKLVKRILHGSAYRHVILGKDFKDIGVGVHRGAPVKHVDASKFMTFTIDLGART